MLASGFSWWVARMTELLPRTLVGTGRQRDGIICEISQANSPSVFLRRSGRQEPMTLGAVARLAGRYPVLLRPPPEAVLEKRHTVPTARRRDLDHLLGHELGRITPFAADAVFWRWQGRPRPGDASRTDVVLTLVPKRAVQTALDNLAAAGLRPTFLEVGSSLLPVDGQTAERGTILLRGLVATCAALACVAILLPFILQAVALGAVDTAIEDLRPRMRQVDALRRDLTAGGTQREILARETARIGDVLGALATVTHILPDDTYLTDFALRERRLSMTGRSASAPRLITGLAADPGIRDAAFTAPVTRIEGATADGFSISAQIAAPKVTP